MSNKRRNPPMLREPKGNFTLGLFVTSYAINITLKSSPYRSPERVAVEALFPSVISYTWILAYITVRYAFSARRSRATKFWQPFSLPLETARSHSPQKRVPDQDWYRSTIPFGDFSVIVGAQGVLRRDWIGRGPTSQSMPVELCWILESRTLETWISWWFCRSRFPENSPVEDCSCSPGNLHQTDGEYPHFSTTVSCSVASWANTNINRHSKSIFSKIFVSSRPNDSRTIFGGCISVA